jgi:hypothetical protein
LLTPTASNKKKAMNLTTIIKATNVQLSKYAIVAMNYVEMKLISQQKMGKEDYQCIKGACEKCKELRLNNISKNCIRVMLKETN